MARSVQCSRDVTTAITRTANVVEIVWSSLGRSLLPSRVGLLAFLVLGFWIQYLLRVLALDLAFVSVSRLSLLVIRCVVQGARSLPLKVAAQLRGEPEGW